MVRKLIGGLITFISGVGLVVVLAKGPIEGWGALSHGAPILGISLGLVMLFPKLENFLQSADSEKILEKDNKYHEQ